MNEKSSPPDVDADQILHIKHSHLAVTNQSGDVLFPFTPGGMTGARHGGLRYQLLTLLDGRRTVREAHAALQDRGCQCGLDELLGAAQELLDEKLLERGDGRREPDKQDRFDRQRLFMGSFAKDGKRFSAEIEEKLAAARVAVIGVGGIGSHVLLSLLAMGVGNLLIVDGDKVALSNLNRQIFYAEQDVGKYKIEVLKQKCPSHNSAVRCSFLHKVVESPQDFIAFGKDCDLIVMTADSPRDHIFSWSHIAANATGTPVLYTQGMILDSIAVGPLYLPGQTACFHCFYPHSNFSCAPPEFRHVNQAYRHGSFMPHIAVAGQLMALEAVKHCTGFHPCRLYNHVVSINLDDYALARTAKPSTECRWCGPGSTQPIDAIEQESNPNALSKKIAT